ncbi:MAG: hypothetical protein CL528_11310 [Aequorivita sp.]|nr:hypothetical protein [Aequorivita sp.]MBP42354.1 hypothetical protein [Aequorivita sp.]|tara:strand:- start:4097 stop:4660 length:564 start_codon:yes stop_codon:yes gene_type:complete
MPTINLLDAYQQAFGGAYDRISTVPFVPPSGLISDMLNGTKETPTIVTDRKSLLGTPMHFPCKLDGYELPNEPLIRVTGQNRIVRTPLDGKNGTFKEFFSVDDYEVVIRGVAINEQNEDMYPETIVRKIREICEAGSAEVTCKLLSFFNIKRLAFEKHDFIPLEGVIWQPFEIKCWSDEPYELELKQ